MYAALYNMCELLFNINLCSVHQRVGEKNTIASYVSSALFNFGALLLEMITAVFVDDIEMREGQSWPLRSPGIC